MAASLVPCSSPLLLQSARMAVLLKPNLSFFFIRRASSSLVCSSAMAPPPPNLIASPSPSPPPQGKDRRESLLDLLRSRHVRDKGRPQGGGGGRGKKSPQDEGMPLPLPSSSPSSFSPLSSFEEAGLNEEMLSVVRELKLSVPTEVQWMGVPAILAGESIVLASHTGSGKTLAYLLPLIQCLRRDEKESGKSTRPRRPRAVVLCPTRELAEQVFHVAKSICHHARFRAVMVGGGCRWRPQEDALNTPVDMVVGTPGRVLVHISEGNMVYGDIKYVVLDEADTMFDAGFGEDIRKFLGPLRNRAATRVGDEGFQTVLVTATITKAVQKLIDEEFPGIRHVHTSTLHKKIATAKHGFIKISGAENKLESLLQVLETSVKKKERVMVFCNTLNSCRAVDHFLRENNIQTINYHGEVPAEERVEGIQKFKDGESSYSVLVCTDLAARGLDLVVDHVVMFDFPLNPIDYLHRTGRTARMGAKGKVTSLVTKRNSSLAEQIEDAISKGETLEALTTVTREKPEVPKKQAVRLNPKERKMPGKKFDSRQVKTGSASAKKLKPALKVKPIRKVSKLAAKFVPGSKKASSSGGRRGAKSARA